MYFIIFAIFSLGLYGTLFVKDLLHKMLFLSVFQSSIIFFYLYTGSKFTVLPFKKSELYNDYSSAAELSIKMHNASYSSPIPVVLMLTAIVVGFTIFALGVTMIVKLKKLEHRA